jgi:magnesium and cobalt transporter
MGDVADGSSSAAQSAQSEDDNSQPQQRGFLGRIFEAFSPVEQEMPASESNGAAPAQPVPVRGLLNLRRLKVVDVAIPTVEIVSVPETITKDELVAVFRESGMTRLPVYRDTLDHPVGMVHLKDFALRFGFNGHGESFDITAMLRPMLYAPPSMPLSVLLQRMQSERTHMALVIDEYGGVDGLLTIEDLIEQVVGEIEDEHDTEDDDSWVREADGTYLAQARTERQDFEAEIGLALVDEEDEEEIDTLGGVIFALAGRVPARGEVIPHPSGVEFDIVDADPRRIKRIRVRLPKSAGA